MSPEAARLGVPPCPDVLAVLKMQATAGRNDGAQFSACLARDPELSAALLVAVNSPLLGMAPKAHRIADAIAVLGIARCAKLAAGLLLSRAIAGFAVPGLGAYWDRIAAEGLTIGYVARELGVADFEDAQLFGLFRHCAVPLLASRIRGYASTYAESEGRSVADVLPAERALYGVDHAGAGALFARIWGLPERVCAAVSRHHETPETLPQAAREHPSRLVAVGFLVDAYIASLRCAAPADRMTDSGQRAVDLLGVSPARSRSLRADVALLLGTDLGERLEAGEVR